MNGQKLPNLLKKISERYLFKQNINEKKVYLSTLPESTNLGPPAAQTIISYWQSSGQSQGETKVPT